MASGAALAVILLGVGLAEAEYFGPITFERFGPCAAWLAPAVGCAALVMVFLRARAIGRAPGHAIGRSCRRRLRGKRPRGASGRGGSDPVWLVLGLVVLGCASHERVALRVARARADEARIWAIEHARASAAGSFGGRLVEAQVAARRDTATGMRCVLTELRDVERAVALPRRARLLVDRDDLVGTAAGRRLSALIVPGERVRLVLRFSPVLARRNPGTPGLARALRRRGLGAQARLVDPGLVVAVGAPDGKARRERWRRTIQAAIAERIEGPGAALARAILLGDRSGLAPRTTEAFRRLGISHLIAISGLHVGLVGGGVVWVLRAGSWIVFRLRGVGPFDGGAGALAFVWTAAAGGAGAYAWWVGAAASVQRAALILALAVAIRHSARSLAVLRALSLAALCMLVVDPELAFDLGARLSFAACLGLASLGARSSATLPPQDWKTRGRDALRWSLAAAAATSVVLPPGGGGIALWGPAVNVLAIPWLAFAVMPGACVAVLAGALGSAEAAHVALTPAAWMEHGSWVLADGLRALGGASR